MIAYSARRLPLGVLLTTAAVGLVWSVGTRLDTQTERTLLSIVTTLGLCLLCADPAAAMTAAAPVPLWWRRGVMAGLGTGLALGSWLAAWSAAVVVHRGTAGPGAWDLLEWAAIAGSQLAAGATVANRRPADPPLSVGLVVAMGWSGVAVGRLSIYLYATNDHLTAWLILGTGALLWAMRACGDPAGRAVR